MPLFNPASFPTLLPGQVQLTVAAIGTTTASALALLPSKYAKITDSTGATFVLPLYTSS